MAERLVAVRLLLNPAGYTAGAATVNRANASMSASTTATATRATAATGAMNAGLKRTSASMAQVAGGAGLLRGGLVNPLTAAGAAVGLVTKASIDWESAWAGVTKTVDGSATQMERLEGDLRNMATELPATHGEIASVAEAAGQLGVKVGDVAEFSRTMVDLGETTNLSADQAATSIARLTNIMGTSQDEVDNLGSALVDLGNNSATTEAEILTLGQRLAAAGNIAGLSESDVLAFAATLTSVGVNAEAGGTALSKVFTSIRDAVLTGGEQLELFATVAGTTAARFADAFREDPARAIASFIEGLGRMNQAGVSTTGVFEQLELTDQRLMRALLSTAEAGDLLTDSIGLASDAWRENTALSEEAERRYGTTSARMSAAFGQIKDAAIDAGGPLADFFATLVEGAADGVTGLQKLDGWLKKVSGTENQNSLENLGQFLRDMGVPEWLLLTDPADPLEQAAGHVAEFDSEIRGLLNRIPPTTDAAAALAGALEENADAAADAATEIDRLRGTLFETGREALALEERQDALADAIDAAREATDDDATSKDEQREALRAVADQSLSVIESMVDQEASTKDVAKATRNARQDFIDVAVEMGIDAERAEELADKYGLIPDDVETTVELINYQRTLERIANIQTQLDILNGSSANYTITETRQINTFFSTFGTQGVSGQRGHDGGMVTTAGVQRFHGGGEVTSTIPRFHQGTTRLASDEVPAILQVGEAVVSKRDMAMAAAMSTVVGPMMGGGAAGFHDQSVGGQFTGSLYLNDGTFLGVIDGRVQQGISQHDRDLKSRVRAGTGRAR